MRKKKETMKKIAHSGETFKHRRIYKLNKIETSKGMSEESKILNDSFQRIKQKNLLEKENNLKSVFEKIDKEINLLNNPEVIKAKIENDAFDKDYNKTLKESLKSMNSKYYDLFQKYLDKGFEIEQFSNGYNIFKLNPLIDSKIGKMYLYYFSKFQNHCIKRYRNNKCHLSEVKAVSYLRKIENIIFPKVDNDTKYKSSKKNINSNKNKKIKKNFSKKVKECVLGKKLLIKKENKSIKARSRSLSINSKNQKINQNSNIEISQNKLKNNIGNNNNNKTDIKSEKNSERILLSNEKKYINKYPTTIKKIAEHKSIINNDMKVNLARLFSKELNNINNDKKNKINNNDQKKAYLKDGCTNIYETPKIMKSNKKYNFKILNEIHDSPSNKSNIKQFTISNSVENNSKKKNKANTNTDVKEFNLSSNRSHLKSITTDTSTNSGQRSNRTRFFNFIEKTKNITNKEFELIPENNKNLKTSINNTNINNDIDKIYNRISSGNIKNIEKNIIKYLKNTKKMSEDDINELLKKFNYKNFLENTEELKHFVLKKSIYKKSVRMYINNFEVKKQDRLLKKLIEKDEDIVKLAKQVKISKFCMKSDDYDN